jgi:hypothetical protein
MAESRNNNFRGAHFDPFTEPEALIESRERTRAGGYQAPTAASGPDDGRPVKIDGPYVIPAEGPSMEEGPFSPVWLKTRSKDLEAQKKTARFRPNGVQGPRNEKGHFYTSFSTAQSAQNAWLNKGEAQNEESKFPEASQEYSDVGVTPTADKLFENENQRIQETREANNKLVGKRNIGGKVDLGLVEEGTDAADAARRAIREAEKARAAEAATRAQASAQAGSAQFGESEDSPESWASAAEGPRKINATEAWNQLKAIHGVLRTHFEALNSRPAQARAEIAKITDPTNGDPSRYPEVRGLKAEANPAKEDRLALALKVGNKLTNAQAILHSLKNIDPTTGQLQSTFRGDLGSDVLHSNIHEAHSILRSANSFLNKQGLNSPISEDGMKDLGQRIDTHLLEKSQEPVSVESLDRDVDEVTGKKANPGHVWVGTRDHTGSLEQMHANEDNLKFLRDKYGKNSMSASRMASFIAQTKPKRVGGPGQSVEVNSVQPGTELPVVEVGRNGHTTTGTEKTTGGKIVTRKPSRTAPAVVPSDVAEKAKQTRATVVAAAKSGQLPSAAKASELEDRSNAVQGLYDQAMGHLRAGNRIPKDLRNQMHPTAIAKAQAQAKQERNSK